MVSEIYFQITILLKIVYFDAAVMLMLMCGVIVSLRLQTS